MIYIQTWAYNAEKTLDRAIKSILEQTFQDFTYHILDNGSDDSTGEIINRYAAEDSRIVAYHSEQNNVPEENLEFWNLTKEIPAGDYYCILDADDTYAPTFLEEMICFAEGNKLDIVACGSRFWDEGTREIIGDKVLNQTRIIKEATMWERFFSEVYWNLRQHWGKLYSSRAAAARLGAYGRDKLPIYGADTIIVLESVKTVGNMGVYPKILHNYFVSAKSYSYQWESKRADADAILYNCARDFLLKICGWISERNQCFLYAMYLSGIEDTLAALLPDLGIELGDKLGELKKILGNPVTRQIFQADEDMPIETETAKREIFQKLNPWLEKQVPQYNPQNIAVLKSVYVQFNPAVEQLMTDEELMWYIQKIPQVLAALALSDYQEAGEILQGVSWSDIDQIFPVCLAQTIAALLENQDAYVSYEKILIEKLIQLKDYERAGQELNEWEQILQEDKDLKKLSAALSAVYHF